MATELTEEQMVESKEAFSVYDQAGLGVISIKDLGTVLRSLDQHPTEADLQDMVAEINTSEGGTIGFSDFLSLMVKQKMKETEAEDDLIEAFKVLDPDRNGFICVNELRRVMTNVGKLTDDEVDEMIRDVNMGDPHGQKITHEEFMKMMMISK